MKRIGGARRKTRNLLSHTQLRSITSSLQRFSTGDRVALVANPSYQKGMFYRRFYGRVAIVVSKRGNSYEVTLRDKGKSKTALVHPIHLKKIQ